ncbi:hypothetical protein [Seonamhaeicola marinus]|uniref:Uncharacterized protein n=1 Tax=Seonamhaeicola marinus TaxID=1912246 RepID=A0A5D0HU37_9FLAO|nr:hypothetical protein [Seonamhaeicola marinus]TYA74903.1 hypothetical protein FUA24_16510 [Seonamhaeicola marinus]
MEEDRTYQKGFNDGYLLQQHEPEIANMLSNVKSDDAYLEAMRAGRDQYLHEMKERFKEHSQSAPNHSKDKGMSPER